MTENTQERELVQGKVAAILNARELVINRGEEAGVRTGMKFKVLADKPTEILDPDTGDVLDYIDREKVRVQAMDVKPKASICKTYRIRSKGYSILSSTGDMIRELNTPSTSPETLRIQDSSLPPPLDEADSYVKKGDRVLELRSDELE